MLVRFLKDDSATTAIEYGLIAALIAIAIISGVGEFADALNVIWGNNTGKIEQALE